MLIELFSSCVETRWGLGLSAEYFPPENEIPFSKMQYAGGPIYTLSLLGFKISLLASYLRIGGFVKTYRLVIHAVIAACVCNQIIFTFLLSFGCNPVRYIYLLTTRIIIELLGDCHMANGVWMVYTGCEAMGPDDSREMHQYCGLVLCARGDESGLRCYHHSPAVADSDAIAAEVAAEGGIHLP